MPNLLIVSASYYRDLADEMIAGAQDACIAAGATSELVELPGALEIPAVIRYAIEGGGFDGFVALGCVIRGETYHFEIVAGESARGLTWLEIEHQAAIGNGILTCDTMEQAWARARRAEGDKGARAVDAALALIAARARFGGGNW